MDRIFKWSKNRELTGLEEKTLWSGW